MSFIISILIVYPSLLVSLVLSLEDLFLGELSYKNFAPSCYHFMVHLAGNGNSIERENIGFHECFSQTSIKILHSVLIFKIIKLRQRIRRI